MKKFISIFYSPEYRKFQAIVLGVLLAAATQGLLAEDISTWVLLVIGVLTSAGVYIVPNKKPEEVEEPRIDPYS